VFLLLIISVQYYLLARFFKKNKLKTVLSAIGLYLLANIVFAFNMVFLIATNVININFDFTNPDPVALNKYLFEHNVPIVLDIVLFLLIGVFYYNYLKKKWTKEVIAIREVRLEEVLNAVPTPKVEHTLPVVTPYYTHFHKVNATNIHLIKPLATAVWNVCYKEIISQEQIDYMLEMMYADDKILQAIEEGEQWEILKADNVAVGYINYRIEEEKVFLSKIYLLQDEAYRGLGQLMMNQVINYALANNKKSIYLTVNKNNKQAIHFYEKNGFKNVKSETFDIGNGYVMDDFIYEKAF